MPTRTRPTTPRIHPTIRRSYEGTACPCEGRETSALLPPNPPPSPSPQAKAAGRRAGGPNQRRNADPSLPLAAVLPALPPLGAGLALPACPKDDHRTVRSHFNGPIPRRSPAAARCGCRACPGEGRGLALRLVSLCRFRAILHRGPRPPFGSRLGRYDLSPFVDVSDAPQRGRPTTDRPVPGSYGSSPFVHLSRSRSNPSCTAPLPGRTGRKKRDGQFKASQIAARAEPERSGVRGNPPYPRGVQRRNPGLGEVPPITQKTSEGGRVGPTNVATLPLSQAEGAGLA